METIGLRAGMAAWRWIVVIAVALAALLAIERWQSDPPALEPRARPPIDVTGVARSYADALARMDLAIANAEAQANAANDQWLLHEVVARNYLERARLSGDYDDYAAAEAALDRAFAVAAPGSGPHLVRAQLEFNMHRLVGTERQLALIDGYAIPSGPDERAEISGMRGDIAFYGGDFQKALRFYEQADQLSPGTASFRRAIYAARTGDIDRAELYFDRTERETRLAPPQLRAYLELQRGILDLERRRLAQAMVHFNRADRIFPGHWLIGEHVAEVLTLQGRLPEAERRYRDIVRDTGHPEFMDALAGVLAKQGRTAESRRLTDQAWGAWQKRLTQFPEAAYGHAVDHCIDKGDWPCAVRLATRNHAARPYGEAKIALAKALLGSGRVADAQALVETIRASPWRTQDLEDISTELRRVNRSAPAARYVSPT